MIKLQMNTSKCLFIIIIIFFVFGCGRLSKVDRTKAPIPGPVPTIKIGDYEKFTLENGLNVIVVENHKIPEVTYQIDLDIIPVLEGKKVGISNLAGKLLKSGTTTHSKDEIDEKIDFIGAYLSTSATGIYATSLKKHSGKLLEVIADVLLNPTFSAQELEKEKQASISELVAMSSDPNAISSRVSKVINYGNKHPYGEYETENSIHAIETEDLVDYYQSFFRPNVAYLTIVGDISIDEAKRNAQKYFGNWEAADVVQSVYSVPQPPIKNRVILVPMEDAVQSVIKITYPLDFRPGGVDNISATLMNKVLGGTGFSSRLMQNIREDKAYTYGAYSSIIKDEIIGEFIATANVRNAVTDSAITEFLYEMKRMTNSIIADSTLKLMKNNSLGKIALSLEDPLTLADFALNIEKHNLPSNYYDNYLTGLENVSRQEVFDVAVKYILPSNCNIIITGNSKDIKESLKKFSSSGNIEVVDEYGEPWTGRKRVPYGVTLEMVLDKYAEASGGKEALEKIRSYRQTGTMSIQGMVLDMVIDKKDDDKLLIDIKMGGNSMMTQVINGENGKRIQMGKHEFMEKSEVRSTKVQTNFLGCYMYKKNGFEAKLVALKNINEEDFYIVEVYENGELQFTDFYNVDTGFKTISKMKVVTPEGNVTAISTYKGFKDYNGIIIPSVSEQKLGSQTMTFTVQKMEQNLELDDKQFQID